MSYLQWDHHQAQGLLRLAQLHQHAPAAASTATATAPATAASSAAADINAILAGVVAVPPPSEKKLRTTADTPSVNGSEDPAAACGRCSVLLSQIAVARSELDRAALLLLSERRRAEDAEARFRSFAQSLAAADSPAASTILMPFLTKTTASAPVSLQGALAGSAGGWTTASAAPTSNAIEIGQAQLTMEAALNRAAAEQLAATATRAGTPGGMAAAFPPSLAASLAKVGVAAEQVELAAAAVAPEQQQRLSAAAAPPPVGLGGLLVAAVRGSSSSVGASGAAAGNDCGVGGRNSPPPVDAVEREASDQPGSDGTPSPRTDNDANLEQIKKDSGGIVDTYRFLNGKPEATKDKDKKMLQDGSSENPKKFKQPSPQSTYCSLLSTSRLNPPSLLVKASAASALASAEAGDERKRKRHSLPTSTPLAALRAVGAAAAKAPPVPIGIPPPKPCLPPHHPGSCSNSVSDAAAAAVASAVSSNISTRRGDPRMNRAVAAKLADPTCTLLHALLEGGFVFPMNHGERECGDHDGRGRPFCGNDKNVVDSEGVSLYQRKNQLNRRLRRAKMEQVQGLAGGGRVGGSIVDKQPAAVVAIEAGAMAQQAR